MPEFSITTFYGSAPARLAAGVILCSVVYAGCGGGPIQPPPPPPPPDPLQLTCPEERLVEATSPSGADVHFDVPSPAGGLAPVTVECAPGSGSPFPLGGTTVQCTATAANMVQTSCEFTVRVRVSQTLARTKFLAFGDSITEGELRPLASLFTIIDRLEAYPFKVEQTLKARYPAQPEIVVINAGVAGEIVHRARSGGLMAGVDRLPIVLEEHQPQVLLLQEGTNDLDASTVSRIAGGLRTMVSTARRRNIEVIIGNILPVGPPHTDSRPTKPAAILELNRRISLIPAEFDGVDVVDLYAVFEADMTLLDPGGLHPTALGYTRIAEAFTDAIVRRYGEQTQSSDSGRRLSRHGRLRGGR